MQNGQPDYELLVSWLSGDGERFTGFGDMEALEYVGPKTATGDCEFPYPWMIRRLVNTYIPELENSTSEQKIEYFKWS